MDFFEVVAMKEHLFLYVSGRLQKKVVCIASHLTCVQKTSSPEANTQRRTQNGR